MEKCITSKTIIILQTQFIASAKPMLGIAQRYASFDCSDHGTEEDDIVHVDDSKFITIPLYPDRPNEELSTRKQRLVYARSILFSNLNFSL